MKVLICDDLSPKGIEVLRKIQGAEVDVKKGLSEADLIATVPEYEAIVVRSATKITAPVIEAAKKLKAVARAGMGYDNIDVKTATDRGVVQPESTGASRTSARPVSSPAMRT